MSFYVADAVNGRNLIDGQPVVGFIIQHQNDVYPLLNNPNENGIYPSHYFAIESLPIFGTVEDCGRLEVSDETQLAVRLALRMMGANNWEEAAEKALLRREVVQFLGRPEPEDGSAGATNKRTYGLCLMHRDTYDYLVLNGRTQLVENYANDGFRGQHRTPEDKPKDIAAVKHILTQCMQSPHNIWSRPKGAEKPTPDEFVAASDLSRVCAFLADGTELRHVLPEDADFPALIQALSTAGGKLFGRDFNTLLRSVEIVGHSLLKEGYQSADEVADLDELLSLFWDCLHLKNRLYDVHRHFYPSFYAGQDFNCPSILDMSRTTLQDAWTELVEKHVGYFRDEENPEVLDAELARMEATVAAMRVKLEKARAQRPR